MKRQKITLDEVFQILEKCAAEGRRCPENNAPGCPDGVPHGTLPLLARMGKIRVEISGSNYRQITILVGRCAGKSTAANPKRHAVVWKTIDSGGMRQTNGVHCL